MSIHHTAMCCMFHEWTVSNTAKQFEVSIGLASENLRLAELIDKYPKLLKLETRQEALKKLGVI